MDKKILAIAIPSIVANVTTPLLGLVDTMIVGHMGSPIYIGAIAVGGVMFNMIYWLFSFLRGGTSGLSAQAYGASDVEKESLVLYRSLGIALAAGVLMVLLQRPILQLLTWFVEPDASTAQLAGRYFSILIYGAPAVLASYALSGWFLGMQNSRMLMITSLVINVVNIAASLILVYALHLRIEGVASGTLVAQWAGLAVGLLLLRRYHLRRISPHNIFRSGELSRFFKVNIDVMLRTICLIAVTLWFTKAGAKQGPIILAVNTLLMQLFLLFSYMMDGFAYAGEALVGRYVGEKNHNDLRLCVRGIMKWGMLMAMLFTLLYFLGGEEFLGILTSEKDVIVAARDYHWWAVSIPFAGFAAFAWDGVFIGATMTRQLLISMAIAMGVFFLVGLLMTPVMGNHALWLAFILYLAIRGLSQTVIFKLYKRNHL